MYKGILTGKEYDDAWLEAERDLATNPLTAQVNCEPVENVGGGTVNDREPIISPKKLEDYKPGATKTQVLEALHIIATTKVKSKLDSKKPS